MRKHWQKLRDMKSIVVQRKFMINKAYMKIRGEVDNNPWTKLVCHNIAEPKHNFMLWLSPHGNIRTKERLLSWGITIDTACMFCQGRQLETRDHLYFDCIVTNKIWKAMLNWQGWTGCPQNWRSMCSWMEKRTRGKNARGIILKASMTAVVYTIWIERNNRIFQKKAVRIEELIRGLKIKLCIRVRTNPTLFECIRKFQ